MIQLYGYELSGNSYKAKLMLSLLGLDYEGIQVDLRGGAHKQPEFLSLNPFGQVPVLVDGAVVLADAQAILVYLARQYGGESWFPLDAEPMSRVVRWLSTTAGEVRQGPELARLYHRFKAPNINLERVTQKAEFILTQLNGHLAEREWLELGHPTIADVAVFPYVALAREGEIDLEQYPKVLTWIDRVKHLPGFVGMIGIEPVAPTEQGQSDSTLILEEGFMPRQFGEIAFTPEVKAAQAQRGSRQTYETYIANGAANDTITPQIEEFIAQLDGFYLGTVSSNGYPYIQFRGGPVGFLKTLDEKTLGFADFLGNVQYITVGNLSGNDKAFLFLMDYRHRKRIKIWGRAEIIEDNADLIERLRVPGYGAKVERAILFHVEATSENCPQHIPIRYSEAEVAAMMQPLRDRIAELEQQ